jgi:CheY-like chemotaxis protein
MFTDRIRFEQVLKNLLSNALKFTHKGFIKLSFESGEPGFITIRVADSGIGISTEAQARIFGNFEQAERHTTNVYGGSGLGLTISREICHLLGGKLTVSSESGKGSEFSIHLPVDSRLHIAQDASEIQIETSNNPDSSEEPGSNLPDNGSQTIDYRVLLIDDSSLHNMALREFLSFGISECLTAESAREAYQVLSQTDIDCVILDMYLPDADGKEVLNNIREDERTRDLPVIIYSGKSLSLKEKESLLEKATAVVPKNVRSYKDLMNKIMDLANKKSKV